MPGEYVSPNQRAVSLVSGPTAYSTGPSSSFSDVMGGGPDPSDVTALLANLEDQLSPRLIVSASAAAQYQATLGALKV